MRLATTISIVSIFLLGILVSSAFVSTAAAAPSTTSPVIVVVKTNMGHYSGVEKIRVSGMLLFTPSISAIGSQPNFPVYITITNPKGVVVASATVPLSSDRFHHVFISGATAEWISGTYRVTASYPTCTPEPPLCVLHPGLTTFTYHTTA